MAGSRFRNATKTLWLDRGFECDHTDGHIDNLARFVAPSRVVCMTPAGRDDPNADVLEEIRDTLASPHDGRGRSLECVTVPSPGEVTDADGEPLSASYMNYCVTNTSVVVPTFGVGNDAAAVDAIAACFPTRRTIGLSARYILAGVVSWPEAASRAWTTSAANTARSPEGAAASATRSAPVNASTPIGPFALHLQTSPRLPRRSPCCSPVSSR